MPGRGCGAQGCGGHLVVDVKANARAVVVLEYSGSATYADNVELIVGDGASLARGLAAGLGDDAVHLSHH